MFDLMSRLKMAASQNAQIPDFPGEAGMREAIIEAMAEIERLQEAKRRALAIADERSKENVALRAALKPFTELGTTGLPNQADIDRAREALEPK